MMTGKPLTQLLFLSSLLVVLQLKADPTPSWNDVPNYKGQAVTTGLGKDQQKVISKINDGSEVARSISELLGNEVWRRQEDITDAVYRSIGDISASFDLIDFNSGSVGFEFAPKRRIYFYNTPLDKTVISNNSVLTINSNKPSKYVLYDSLESRLNGEIKLLDDVGQLANSSFNVKGDVGIGLYYIQNVASPRQLPPTDDSNAILNLTDAQKNDLSAPNLKSKNIFTKLGSIAVELFNGLESKIAKTADKISDEDSSKVFFTGLFDAIRLPGKLPINDKSVIEKMKTGDIVTMSIFSGGGPDLSVKQGVLKTSASAFVRIAYQITVKKLENNKVLVRPKLALKRGWDATPLEVKLGASLGIVSLSYTPFFLRFEGANSYTLESLIEFDLNDPASADAFNDAMSLSLKKAGDLIMKKDPSTKVSDRIYEKAKISKQELYFNIGLAKLAKERVREVSKTESIDDSGNKKFSWTGEVRASSYSHLRLWNRDYEVGKSTQSIMKSNIDNTGVVLADVQALPGSAQLTDENLSRVNMTTLYDNHATRTDLYKMLEFARLSVGVTGSLLPSQILSQIESYYSSKKTSEQSLTIISKISREVIHTVLKMDKERFWRLVAESLLVNPNQALTSRGNKGINLSNDSDRSYIRINQSQIRWNTCQTTSLFQGSAGNVPCRWVWMTMNAVGTAFERIQKADSDEERLKELTKLESFLGITPLINNLFAVGYKSITGNDAKISYYLKFSPQLGSMISPYNSNIPSDLSSDIFKKRYILGELNEVTDSERRIKGGSAYFDKSNSDSPLYVNIVSPAMIAKDQIVTLWLQDHRVLRRDIPLATGTVSDLLPQVLKIDAQESLFNYEIQVPKELVAKMVDGKNELQIRIENSKGEPLSELGRLEIRKK